MSSTPAPTFPPADLANLAGESISAYAGRLAGIAFQLQQENERLRSAIEEHRSAKATAVSGTIYYSESVYDRRLWETLDDR